ncbi:MAG: DUF2478 domain-containing protein [Candidatus Aminicenantes bacterium]|nr:DUF2478 domain-containing protein [Candidatus Aminicenantes bacterium]
MQKTPLFILTGQVHSGKTSLLVRICADLTGQGWSLNGLLSRAYFNENRFCGYNGYDIHTGVTFPLIRTIGEPEWDHIGRFYFLPEGMKQAEDSILAIETSRLTVIDEMGPLELAGKGFWKPFLKLQESGQPTLVVVRKELLNSFTTKAEVRPTVFRMDQPDISEALKDGTLTA